MDGGLWVGVFKPKFVENEYSSWGPVCPVLAKLQALGICPECLAAFLIPLDSSGGPHWTTGGSHWSTWCPLNVLPVSREKFMFLPKRTHGQAQVHEGYSALLIIGKMHIKTTVRYHLTPIRMAIIKKTSNKKCW